MYNLKNIKKIELEITSACNAACPGCARTQNLDILKINSITLADIKRLFPDTEYIKDKQFKFCGVLGDPILNKECLEMVEYLSTRGGYCQLSTNGGYQNAKWWSRLGELSLQTNNVDIHFCIDGHKDTNHIYRVNTNFEVITRNMKAYSEGGNSNASATWIYIVFDHNEHELDNAKEHAKQLGFNFATRTGMRNSYHQWVSSIKAKNRSTNKIETTEKVITTTGKKEHSKKDQVKTLVKIVNDFENNNVDPKIIDNVVSSVTCKYVHEKEIFISSDLKLWPCCFLWDSYFKNKENIKDKFIDFKENWNCLNSKSIDEILKDKWYQETLELSWNLLHNMHIKRCILTCAYNKAYHNEIKIEN